MNLKDMSCRIVVAAACGSLLTLTTPALDATSEVPELLDLTEAIAEEQKLEVDTTEAANGFIGILVGHVTSPRTGQSPVYLGYSFDVSGAAVRYARLIVVRQGNIRRVIRDLGDNPKLLKTIIGGPETIKLHKALVKMSKKHQIRLEESEGLKSSELARYLGSIP